MREGLPSDKEPPPSAAAADDRTVIGGAADRGSLRPGAVLSNTYRIEELLARGGMGEVYRALHVELGTAHAIKLILPDLANDKLIVSLFIEEARQLGRIAHDAIVQYQGFLREDNGSRYLVMEYVDGEPLQAVLQRRRLDPPEVLALLRRLGEGLSAVHDRGIVHRDISPQNIILPGGRVEQAKLIDFGIAKSAEPSPLTLMQTDFAGKYSFVSPEQVGLFGGKADQRSDIYSLGLVLATAAQGRRFDMGSSPASVIEARQRVPDLAALPASLRPVIARMLQSDPARRPASIRALLDEQRTAAMPAAVDARDAPGRRDSGAPVWIAGGAVVAALALVGIMFAIPKAPPSVEEMRAGLAEIARSYQCSDLSYEVSADRGVSLSGFAAGAADVARLRRAVASLPGVTSVRFAVEPRIWPYCEAAARLKTLVAGRETRVPRLALASSDQQAHVGSPLALEIETPPFDGYVYVDYFTQTGEVLHLFPNDKDPINLRPRRNKFVLGKPPMRRCWLLAGEPGQELVTAVVAAAPLFATRRPEVERASDYLPQLGAALDAAETRQLAAGMLFFELQPSKSAAPPEDGCAPG